MNHHMNVKVGLAVQSREGENQKKGKWFFEGQTKKRQNLVIWSFSPKISDRSYISTPLPKIFSPAHVPMYTTNIQSGHQTMKIQGFFSNPETFENRENSQNHPSGFSLFSKPK